MQRSLQQTFRCYDTSIHNFLSHLALTDTSKSYFFPLAELINVISNTTIIVKEVNTVNSEY